jgi:hypothetical protein
MATTLEAIQPYVEQLFDDSDVRQQLSRASANLRDARSRARRAKSKKQALKDPRLRDRLVAGGRAASAAVVAIGRGPELQRRRKRRGRLLALAGMAAVGSIAANPTARARLRGLLGDDKATTA